VARGAGWFEGAGAGADGGVVTRGAGWFEGAGAGADGGVVTRGAGWPGVPGAGVGAGGVFTRGAVAPGDGGRSWSRSRRPRSWSRLGGSVRGAAFGRRSSGAFTRGWPGVVGAAGVDVVEPGAGATRGWPGAAERARSSSSAPRRTDWRGAGTMRGAGAGVTAGVPAARPWD
jgi:hypothetical protein